MYECLWEFKESLTKSTTTATGIIATSATTLDPIIDNITTAATNIVAMATTDITFDNLITDATTVTTAATFVTQAATAKATIITTSAIIHPVNLQNIMGKAVIAALGRDNEDGNRPSS